MIEPQNLKILLNLTPFSLPLIPISRLPLTPFDFFNSHHKFLIYLNLISKYCSVKILISIYAIPPPPPFPLRATRPSVSITPSHFITLHDVTFKATILFYCFHSPSPTTTFTRARNHMSHVGHIKSRDGQDLAFIGILFMS